MTWSARSSTWHPPDWRRTRALVHARDAGRCRWPVASGECGSTDRVQVDRITPWSQGGSSGADNAWCLCHAHHGRKTQAEARAARTARTHRATPTHPSSARK